jgi:hypothetical protein
VREIEWTDAALEHMAALDKGVARRVKQAVERFADTGAGSGALVIEVKIDGENSAAEVGGKEVEILDGGEEYILAQCDLAYFLRHLGVSSIARERARGRAVFRRRPPGAVVLANSKCWRKLQDYT